MQKKIATLVLALSLGLGVCAPAWADVETGQAEIGNLEMKWPIVHVKNKKATNLINRDIQFVLSDFRNDYIGRKFTAGRTWYETKYEDKQLVSLTLSDLRAVNGVNKTITHGLVYDASTGQRLPLSAFVRVTLQDLQKLQDSHVYRDGDVRHKPTKPITRVPEDFFLSPDGCINILFQTEELGSLLDGPCYLKLGPQEVRELNEKNPKP